ncbi:MAG: hypothetical protein HY099_01765 [Nitrospirae bacterium]|nr:hypothetical protein [Nitrospirota bacterium]
MLKALEDVTSTKKRLKIEIPAETIEAEIKKGDFQRNTPLSMTVTVDVRPKIENLAYHDIAVKDIPVEVSDEEIEAVLKNLAEEKATYEAVDDVVNTGDLLTIDYTVREDEPSANDVVLKAGSGPYPQEFFDGLLGRKKDEEFEIEAAFPEDMQSQFAGKKPRFAIRIKDIKRRNVVPIDDEFAKDLGLENLGMVREKVRENILAAKGREADRAKQRQILDKLIESHEFEAPESLLDAEIARTDRRERGCNRS